jgi:hypothetical protein
MFGQLLANKNKIATVGNSDYRFHCWSQWSSLWSHTFKPGRTYMPPLLWELGWMHAV